MLQIKCRAKLAKSGHAKTSNGSKKIKRSTREPYLTPDTTCSSTKYYCNSYPLVGTSPPVCYRYWLLKKSTPEVITLKIVIFRVITSGVDLKNAQFQTVPQIISHWNQTKGPENFWYVLAVEITTRGRCGSQEYRCFPAIFQKLGGKHLYSWYPHLLLKNDVKCRQPTLTQVVVKNSQKCGTHSCS